MSYFQLIKQGLAKERAIKDVPPAIKIGLIVTLVVQLIAHGLQNSVIITAKKLTQPAVVNSYIIKSFGEPIVAAKILNLWLQSHDSQAGAHLSFHQLDYQRLTQWLDTILALDPKGAYPMLVASHIYGSVQDDKKQRIMLDYIYKKFNQNPNQHWRWLAESVISAKYGLKDNQLALKFANALAEKATAKTVPYWARDMKIMLLEDMGQIKAATLLVGALIDSKQIADPFELKFLINKLEQLSSKKTLE